jgi:hypothetical protein
VQGPRGRARRKSAKTSDWHNHKMEDDGVGATLDELWAALDAAQAAVAAFGSCGRRRPRRSGWPRRTARRRRARRSVIKSLARRCTEFIDVHGDAYDRNGDREPKNGDRAAGAAEARIACGGRRALPSLLRSSAAAGLAEGVRRTQSAL